MLRDSSDNFEYASLSHPMLDVNFANTLTLTEFFSCSLIFGVLSKISPCRLISNPLTSSQTFGLDERRNWLRCHCYISDPCVHRLAEASALQPWHWHHTAWRRRVKGTAAFFHSISAWHTGLWGQAEIISFPLSFYSTSQAHYTCANSQTHISKETFYLASIVSSEKCRKSLLRVILFSQKLPNNITVPASLAL